MEAMKRNCFIIFVVLKLVYCHLNQLTGRACEINGTVRCCRNYFDNNRRCEPCPVGSESEDGVHCTPCTTGYFGKNCADQCTCDKTEICDNVDGCIGKNKHSLSTDTVISSQRTTELSNECQPGYTLQAGDICKPCLKGYYGPMCVLACCCHEVDICHHIKGCKTHMAVTTFNASFDTSSITVFSTIKESQKNRDDKDIMFYVWLCIATLGGVFITLFIKHVIKTCTRKRTKEIADQTEETTESIAYLPQTYQYIDESRMSEASFTTDNDNYLDACTETYETVEPVTTESTNSSIGTSVLYKEGSLIVQQPWTKASKEDINEYNECEIHTSDKEILKTSICINIPEDLSCNRSKDKENEILEC